MSSKDVKTGVTASATTTRQYGEEPAGVSLMDLALSVRKHIVTAIVGFAVVLGAVGAYTLLATPNYTATAELFASYDFSTATTEDISAITMAGSYISNQIKSYPDLAKTQAVLDPVIRKLGLQTTAKGLSEGITVTNPEDTLLVRVEVESDEAAQSQRIADSVAESLSEVVASSLYSTSNSLIKLEVVQHASLPQQPSTPNIKLNVLLGLVVGLMVGLAAAIVKDMADTRLHSAQDLEKLAHAALLGSIPESEVVVSKTPVVINEPGALVSEEYRRIRSNLSFTLPVEGEQSRLIVLTSTDSGEGKTTTAVNLAVAFAENESRVLLIDADLRHSSVADKMNIDGTAGLSHVLSGQARVVDVVQTYWKPNLHIMPAGVRPPNASLLLNSATMQCLLGQALKQYDYVIVDTTPMSIAADASVFGRISDGIVLVAGRERCDIKELTAIVEQFDNAEVPILGTIFNFAERVKRHNGNYYYYASDRKSKRGSRTRQPKGDSSTRR